jgi:hypothetical protein
LIFAVAIETFPEFVQVIQCGFRRRDNVPATVIPPVTAQAGMVGSHRHELPDSSGAGGRNGKGIKGTFDDRQQGQFRRQTALIQTREDVVEVGLTAA